jgi:hypothetical protein
MLKKITLSLMVTTSLLTINTSSFASTSNFYDDETDLVKSITRSSLPSQATAFLASYLDSMVNQTIMGFSVHAGYLASEYAWNAFNTATLGAFDDYYLHGAFNTAGGLAGLGMGYILTNAKDFVSNYKISVNVSSQKSVSQGISSPMMITDALPQVNVLPTPSLTVVKREEEPTREERVLAPLSVEPIVKIEDPQGNHESSISSVTPIVKTEVIVKQEGVKEEEVQGDIPPPPPFIPALEEVVEETPTQKAVKALKPLIVVISADDLAINNEDIKKKIQLARMAKILNKYLVDHSIELTAPVTKKLESFLKKVTGNTSAELAEGVRKLVTHIDLGNSPFALVRKKFSDELVLCGDIFKVGVVSVAPVVRAVVVEERVETPQVKTFKAALTEIKTMLSEGTEDFPLELYSDYSKFLELIDKQTSTQGAMLLEKAMGNVIRTKPVVVFNEMTMREVKEVVVKIGYLQSVETLLSNQIYDLEKPFSTKIEGLLGSIADAEAQIRALGENPVGATRELVADLNTQTETAKAKIAKLEEDKAKKTKKLNDKLAEARLKLSQIPNIEKYVVKRAS